MLHDELNILESKIAAIEEQIEENHDFNEFQPLYDELIVLRTTIKDVIDSFPYGEVSEKREELFEVERKKFEKLEKRIQRINDEADIENGKDAKWMFDNDEED